MRPLSTFDGFDITNIYLKPHNQPVFETQTTPMTNLGPFVPQWGKIGFKRANQCLCHDNTPEFCTGKLLLMTNLMIAIISQFSKFDPFPGMLGSLMNKKVHRYPILLEMLAKRWHFAQVSYFILETWLRHLLSHYLDIWPIFWITIWGQKVVQKQHIAFILRNNY